MSEEISANVEEAILDRRRYASSIQPYGVAP
jgi:hypothetical protein